MGSVHLHARPDEEDPPFPAFRRLLLPRSRAIDAETLAKLHRRTTDLFMVLMCSAGLGRFSAEVIRDPDVRTAVKRYQEKLPAAKTQQERNAAAGLLVKDLRLAATIDVENAQRRISYDHFAKMLGTETQMREPVSRTLDRAGTKLEMFDAEAQMISAIESRKHR